MIIQMNARGTLTLPKSLRAHLPPDAFFEAVQRPDGVIELQPRVAIEPSQAWYWTEDWQKREAEADREIAEGRVHHFNDAEDFLAWLDSPNRDKGP
jgi:hypothetical protein